MNPTKPHDLSQLGVLESFMNQRLPIRSGILFATQNYSTFCKSVQNNEPNFEITDEVKVVRIFKGLKAKFGTQLALAFFRNLQSQFQGDGELKMDAFSNAIQFAAGQRYANIDAYALSDQLSSSTDYDFEISAADEFICEKGLSFTGTSFLNGYPCGSGSLQEVT